MALAYVGRAGSASGATQVSSFSATLSSSIASGDLIIVSIACSNVGDLNDLTSVTDSAGNTYTSAKFTVDGGQNSLCAVWYCANCSALSNGNTVTAHLSSSLLSSGEAWFIAVDDISGAATASVTDGTNGHNSQSISSTGTWDTNTITTTNANDLLWVAMGGNQNEASAIVQASCLPTSGWTIPTGQTGGPSSGDALRTAYQIVSATGTYQGGGTSATFGNGVSAIIVAFKQGAGGSTPITGSDSATGAETQSLGLLPTDTGTGSEAQSSSVTFPASDSGAGAEAQAVTFSQADSGAGSETAATSASTSPTDSAAGAEAQSLGLPVAESATGSESAIVANAISSSDSASVSESATITPAVSESGTLSESAVIPATLSPTDSGAGVDTPAITFTQADSGTGSETVAVGNVIASSDTATGSESAIIGPAPSDAGTLAESDAISATFPASDSGAGVDTPAITFTQADSGAGAEALTAGPAVTETGAGGQTAGLSTQLPVAESATGSESVSVSRTGVPTLPPPPMPLISLNAPAYASDITYPPGRANDDLYGTLWRSGDGAGHGIPSVGTPVWLAYDLSGVASGSRGKVMVALYNEQGNFYLKPDSSDAFSLFTDYSLQGNAAAGGGPSAPSSGWVDLITPVTGNLYPTRHHLVDLTGYNWLRLICTKSTGVPNSTDDLNVQMDVHDASKGHLDSWLFLGDSITLNGMFHPKVGGGDWSYGGPVCKIVRDATGSAYYPQTIDGGSGGWFMSDAAANISGLLANFTGGFVVLAYGTNDANQNFFYTGGDSHVTTYYANLLTCIDAAQAAGFKVIVPYVPYGSNYLGILGYNANLFNQWVDAHLGTDRPTVLRGPDFWTLFQQNQNLLQPDGIHPTFDEVSGAASGYERMHLLYADWLLDNIYLWETDTATGTETEAIGQPRSDAATGSEAESLAASLAPTDSAVGAESATTALSAADAATGAESIAIGPAQAENATGAETAGPITLPVSDVGAGAESVSIAATLAPSDTGAGSETIDVGGTGSHAVTGSDAATGAESISIAAAIAGSDAATGAETFGPVSPVVADAATGAETVTIPATLAHGDAGAGGESIAIAATMAESDTGVGSELDQAEQAPALVPAPGFGILIGPAIIASTSTDKTVIVATAVA